MGNRGMTNWKFSLFLVIALTLVAGLFADTAHAGNGDGTMVLTYTPPADATLIAAADGNPTATPPVPATPLVVEAGSTGYALTFTYMADDPQNGPINMNGGRVRLDVPAAWAVKIDDVISVVDGTDNLYLTTARLTDDAIADATTTGIRGPAAKEDRDLRRITLTVNGDDNVTKIEVDLDDSDWSVDRGIERALVITLGTTEGDNTGLTAPIPASLPSTLNRDSGVHFMNYQFTAYALVTGGFGSSSRLKPDNDDATPTHPAIKVGNIANAAAGTASSDPATTYVGEEGDFVIRFTAAGPIYDLDANKNGTFDAGDIDARIVVNLSSAIDTHLTSLPARLPGKIWVNPSAPGTPITAPDPPVESPTAMQVDLKRPPAVTTVEGNRLRALDSAAVVRTLPSSASGYVSIARSSGVTFGTPKILIVDAEADTPAAEGYRISDNGIVTINIVKMNKDGYVDLRFKKVFAAAATDPAETLFAVSVASDNTTPTALDGVGTVVSREATGTIEVAPAIAEVRTPQDFTITYTAATSIQDAYLIVTIPTGAFEMPSAEDDTQLVDLTLTDAKHPDPDTVGQSADDSDTTVDDTRPHPNRGGNPGVPYGTVQMTRRPANAIQTLVPATGDYTTVVWGPLSLSTNGIFEGKIRNVRITETTGVYDWTASLSFEPPETDGTSNRPTQLDSTNTLTIGTNLNVLQADANPTDPDVTFEMFEAIALPLSTLGSPNTLRTASVGGFGFYDASSRYRLTFRFTAERTPLKQGKVSFTMPSGWSNFSKDAGTLGYTTYTSEGAAGHEASGYGSRTFTIKKLDLEIGQTVSITYGAKSSPPDAVDDDMIGAFSQPNAAANVKITSRFDVDDGGRIRERASNEINITVENVIAGSGTATISPRKVEAGSIVSLTAVFRADGTMDGGQVDLQMPANWGDLQQTDATKDNFVEVTPSGGTIGDWDTNGDLVQVNLTDFDDGDTLRFALSNVVAQPSQLGVVNFLIRSAGKAGESLEPVVGEEPPDGAYTNDGVNLERLLGRVYTTDCIDDGSTAENEDYDGYLRVAVTGGGDGGGRATVEIVGSERSGKYMIINDDGEAEEVDVRQLHAGDGAKTNLLFTYQPIETIIDGELKFTVPSGWADPQTDSQSEEGFTVVNSGGRIGPPDASGGSVTVPIYLINRDNTITIDYGAENGAVTPPDVMGPETFTIEIKGSATGRLKPIGRQPMVHVRAQASGKGAATVEADGTLYAGSTGNSVTITYTAAGQVVDGDLKITVPDKWSPATSDHFNISGSVVYGGELTDAQRADDDPVDNHISDDAVGLRELIISGIDLRAGESYSVEYEDVTVQPTVAEGVAFKIEFRGDGPGTDFVAVGVPLDETGAAIADAQKVDVLDVAPGSGTVEVIGPAVTTVGLTAYDVTIIFTAEAQISADKVIAVQIPEGWSDPIDDDQAMDADGNYNVGTYTVVHTKADGTPFTDRYGDPIDGHIEKTAVADRKLMATVTGDGVAADETVTFTYQNATAPDTTGVTEFQVYYDGAQVESDDDTVLVQSAEGATMLGLSSEADTFIIDDDGSVTITVMLQAADSSAATRTEATAVTLSSSSATGSFDPATVTIPSGETEGTSSYSDQAVGSVEITASTTGLADPKPLTIVANTEMPMIESVDFSPKVAKDLDTITVTAVGTPFQNPTFLIDTINVSGISMTEDAGDGNYSGTHRLARGSAEGMHSVTVSINGVSLAADDMLTVDNAAPSVEITAPTAGMTVVNGDTITISATVTDTSAVTVTADVSKVDSEAAADSVTLTAGTGTHTISEANINVNDEYTITVTATDAAGNTGSETVAVMLNNTRSFTSMIPNGVSLFSVPLEVEGLDTVADLKAALGDSVLQVIAHRGGADYDADSDDVAITGDRGLILVTNAAVEHEFVGRAWGGGTATISVDPAANTLIGVPVDTGDMMVSDLLALFPAGVAQAVVISAGDNKYPRVTGADDPNDAAVTGDAAYLVIGAGAGEAMVSGAGWSNGTASAAPIALSGYQLDTQTPLVSVYGSVVDETTGLAKEGFRVKVKNLTTKAALSEITSVEAADGYNITFVDLTDAHAARVGDVLEISADSPDPLVGIQPVRHIVTVDDVKNSTIQLENLIAYEIPAETVLLRNYPNPFNPETWIPYHLSEDADVKLTIYDVNGKLVRDIDVGHQTAAKYDTRSKAIYWDGRNRFGEQVASGIYFYHLSAGDDFSATRKMVILK